MNQRNSLTYWSNSQGWTIALYWTIYRAYSWWCKAHALKFDLCDLDKGLLYYKIPYEMSINQVSLVYEWLNPNYKKNRGEKYKSIFKINTPVLKKCLGYTSRLNIAKNLHLNLKLIDYFQRRVKSVVTFFYPVIPCPGMNWPTLRRRTLDTDLHGTRSSVTTMVTPWPLFTKR